MVNPNSIQTGAVIAALELLNDQQAAGLLQVEPRTLRLWRHERGLPFVKITSKVIRYRKTDLDGWLAKRVVSRVA